LRILEALNHQNGQYFRDETGDKFNAELHKFNPDPVIQQKTAGLAVVGTQQRITLTLHLAYDEVKKHHMNLSVGNDKYTIKFTCTNNTYSNLINTVHTQLNNPTGKKASNGVDNIIDRMYCL